MPPRRLARRQRHEDFPSEIYANTVGLRTTGGLSGRQRAERAYRFGAADREAELASRAVGLPRQSSDRIGLSSACFVVLRDREETGPLWTRSRVTYFDRVKVAGGFVGRCVPRGFPSQCEARAYCVGAGLDGLPAER